MKKLLDELRETAELDEKYEQGGGNSILLIEASDEIERLRAILQRVNSQFNSNYPIETHDHIIVPSKQE